MARNIILVFVVAFVALLAINYFHQQPEPNLKLEVLKNKYAIKDTASVDHSLFTSLQQKFTSPQEVTMACLECHNGTHKEIMASAHWNWERVSYIEGRGIKNIGKKNILNNFCIGAESNEQACAKCHIGFGMSDDQFDFENKKNVDCMVCHDNSELYIKGTSLAGYPDREVNLTEVAQHVGNPQKANCGACHFYSGGGNNVKHGDLEEGIIGCDREVDVHMTAGGMDMECTACHTTQNHDISGKLYSVSSNNVNRATCESCHSNTPHHEQLLNTHTAKVSCQACHIPTYAKVNSTKMNWKWSEAGRLENGLAFTEEDSLGNHTYMSIKGSFEWDKNIQPDYVWFNGNADHYLLGDTIDDSKIVTMNQLIGSHSDPESKIVPVKIHRGDQIYDKKYKMLIQPKLYSFDSGDSAYWVDFNWNDAAAAGMKRIGLPYSGEYGFVQTEMYWPINHMVAPKEQAVSCAECHNSTNSRLAGLDDFYMPGRDKHAILDKIGRYAIILALAGIFIHGFARFFQTSNWKKQQNWKPENKILKRQHGE
ncbi:MAG: tetrathionate reductase family octaheme c-type cytochrome [Cyclobacteriaceae bacterium]|nr:tetrathionate reductase family octaheme c-type cytochrome [Cyclobacteriaceae bacterium]